MTDKRKIIDPEHFGFVVNKDILFEFKQMTRTKSTKPTDIIRMLFEDYVQRKRSKLNGDRTEFDILLGVKDQIDILVKNDTFKLNDLVCVSARRAVSEMRQVNATYNRNGRRQNYPIKLGPCEFASVKFPKDKDHLMIMTSNVHKFVIRQQGFFIYVDMPKEYSTLTDETLKFTMIRSLMTSVEMISMYYREAITAEFNKLPKPRM